MTTLSHKTYAGIDRFRLIAAILVVTIHTSPLVDISATADFVLTRIIARTAVPFFFMASGFFLFPKTADGGPRPGRLAPFLRKTGFLYVVAILFYLPVNIYAGMVESWRVLPSLLSDIVFNGTFYHLWYLPAAIIGSVIVWLLLKKLGTGPALAICLALYAVGVFGDSYYGLAERIPALNAFYAALFSIFDYTRNGLFFAPLFFLVGALLARRDEPMPLRASLAGLTVSFVLMLVEGLLLHRYDLQRHDSMYLLLPVCMFFLFMTLLHWDGKSRKGLRDLSMLLYLIHPAVIVAVRGFAGAVGLDALLVDDSLIHFMAVLAVSIALSIAVAAVLARSRDKNGAASMARAWTEIDLNRLRHNLGALRGVLPERCRVMAVVKADAYGHGALEIAACLNRLGVYDFAVAAMEEGVRLRRQGIKGNILVLGYTPASEADRLCRYRLTQTVVDLSHACELDACGRTLHVHVKINTGMNRLGENYPDAAGALSIFRLKNLVVDGIFTHLSVSDSLDDSNVAFTKQQIKRFYALLGELKKEGIHLPAVHIQSTYGVLNYPQADCDFARVGLGIYGVLSQPGDKTVLKPDLKPVLSLKSRVALVRPVAPGESVSYGREFNARRPSKIAVITAGFADGIPRTLSSGKGEVLINGRRAPIAGRVCMDQLMADVTDIPDIARGDVVTFIGQDGEEEIRAEEMAESAGTITNELLSRLGGRLEHVFKKEEG